LGWAGGGISSIFGCAHRAGFTISPACLPKHKMKKDQVPILVPTEDAEALKAYVLATMTPAEIRHIDFTKVISGMKDEIAECESHDFLLGLAEIERNDLACVKYCAYLAAHGRLRL
jgi:hypothetical protein